MSSSLKQFILRTLAEDVRRLTGDTTRLRRPFELHLDQSSNGGFLVRQRIEPISHLPAPWPEVTKHDEVMVEFMSAERLRDHMAFERALLCQQARRVQRLEEDPTWLPDEPLWVVAPYLPERLAERYTVERFAPGCYRLKPSWAPLLWIASNELPLCDELLAFLRMRSGPALDELDRWLAARRPPE